MNFTHGRRVTNLRLSLMVVNKQMMLDLNIYQLWLVMSAGAILSVKHGFIFFNYATVNIFKTNLNRC